jgi:hypothetical protein
MTHDANNRDSSSKRPAPDYKRDTISIDMNETFDVHSDAAEAVRRYQEAQTEVSELLNRKGYIVHGDVMLRIEVEGSGTPLLLPLIDEAVIGRRDPSTQASPELDLTPYGAYQLGISRRHASIERRDNVPVLVDLGSRNGTFLNGHRLEANQVVPIHQGDEIRLGKIVMKIYIEEQDAEDIE